MAAIGEVGKEIKEGNIIADIKAGRSRSLNLRGVSLAGADLRKTDLSMADLSGADLTGADLSGAKLFKSKLNGAVLLKARLRNAELTGADLSSANMEGVDAGYSGFGMTILKNACLFNANFEGVTLTKADLNYADLRCICLRNARLRETDLTGADLTSANLCEADLSLSNVKGATFNNSDMRQSRLRLVKGYDKAQWIGVDIRDTNFAGAYQMRRFIIDQNYIKEFRESSRLSGIVYYIWWITSDCGRSLTRWFLWIMLLAFMFGLLYSFVGIDYGEHQTWLSPVYYSIVTLTTLGYGDIVPATTASQIVAIAEVITGYMMLGGLLSIFSNKIARRGE